MRTPVLISLHFLPIASQITEEQERNMSGTESKIDTPVARGGSRHVRYELIDKDGIPLTLKGKMGDRTVTFTSVQIAADYAKLIWPDQEQDPDRTGKGWDIQVVR